MKKINFIADFYFTDSFNILIGSVVTFLTFVFGKHWLLFILFLMFNIIDWISGWYKARVTKTENSLKGWQGLLKKLSYWLIIAFAFALSTVFIEIGHTLSMDLGVTTILGWFVLANLIVNEARSILENFVEAGLKVPAILIRGLEVANQVINSEKQEDKGDNK